MRTVRRVLAVLALIALPIAGCSADDQRPPSGTGTDVNTDVGDGGTVTTVDSSDTGDDGTDTSTPGTETDAGQTGSDTATSMDSGTDADLGGGTP